MLPKISVSYLATGRNLTARFDDLNLAKGFKQANPKVKRILKVTTITEKLPQ